MITGRKPFLYNNSYLIDPFLFRLYPQEEPYWADLERSGAAWAVTTIDAPYIVMHATSAWYKMFNIKHSQGRRRAFFTAAIYFPFDFIFNSL